MKCHPPSWNVVQVECPACGLKAPYWCGRSVNGPTAHERRIKAWEEREHE